MYVFLYLPIFFERKKEREDPRLKSDEE